MAKKHSKNAYKRAENIKNIRRTQQKKVEDQTVKLNVRSSKDYIYCFN